MLNVAKDCFTTAMSVTSAEEIEPGGYSEEWLLHYMLGKIGEKLRRPPNEYLDHYEKVTVSQISPLLLVLFDFLLLYPVTSMGHW